MKRKDFIINSSWIALGVSASILLPSCSTEPDDEVKPTTNNDLDCNTTTEDILGPYYRANSPTRSRLRIDGESGQKLRIEGLVQNTKCNNITNAKVEIWHANDKGEYDNDSSEFKYRGQVQSDDKAVYAFDTIVPGKYLNGADYRPSHIHFKVSADGYKTLVSQVYFKNDEHIAKDPWASDPSAELRILEMKTKEEITTVNFNIILDEI